MFLFSHFERQVVQPHRLAGVVLDLYGVLLLVEQNLRGIREPALAFTGPVEPHFEERERVIVRPWPVRCFAEADDARGDDDDAPAAVFTGEIHGVTDVGAEPHDAVRVWTSIQGS